MNSFLLISPDQGEALNQFFLVMSVSRVTRVLLTRITPFASATSGIGSAVGTSSILRLMAVLVFSL
ncbi:hypothetical protein QUA44_18895 [Microcoleus sp. N9_A2]|uniref:hypothetical protein n=1 Tax=unclassified Microcoleus TaxID=2642155 RepID=UPI002FD2388A